MAAYNKKPIMTERDPARSAVAIVPSNTAVIPATRGLHVNAGGTLVVLMALDGGNNSGGPGGANGPVVLQVAKYQVLPYSVVQVLASSEFGTSTAVTDAEVVALY